MVIRLEIESWVIAKGGTKREDEKGGGEELWGCWVF
jgi:hypothetical protein